MNLHELLVYTKAYKQRDSRKTVTQVNQLSRIFTAAEHVPAQQPG